jgi:hypothetical protein
MDLREIGWGHMDWIYLAQDRDQWRALVNTVMNLRVPYVWKFLNSCVTGGFSKWLSSIKLSSLEYEVPPRTMKIYYWPSLDSC